MATRAGFALGLAAVLAASSALAQRSGARPEPASPYLDPKNPLFQLPPDPTYTPSPIYPAPAKPGAIPDTQTPAPAPYPGGLTPRSPGSLPQGFTMTIRRATSGLAAGELGRPRQVGEHLAACWEPPAPGTEVSVRVAFNRDGAVIGKPRVTYVKAGRGADRAAVAGSMEKAFARCLPLRFTADLGSAIAGRPFALRFIAPGAARP